MITIKDSTLDDLWDVFNDFWANDGDGYLSDADPEDNGEPTLAIEDGEVDEPEGSEGEPVDGNESDVPTTQPEQTQDEDPNGFDYDPYADRVTAEIEGAGLDVGDTPGHLGGENASEPVVFGPQIEHIEPDSQLFVDSPEFPATQPSPDFADAVPVKTSGGPSMGEEMPPPPAFTPAQIEMKRKRMAEIQYP